MDALTLLAAEKVLAEAKKIEAAQSPMAGMLPNPAINKPFYLQKGVDDLTRLMETAEVPFVVYNIRTGEIWPVIKTQQVVPE